MSLAAKMRVQDVLEECIKHTDLSILSYISTMIEEHIAENPLYSANDLYVVLSESLFTYQMATDEQTAYDICYELYQGMVKHALIADPEDLKKQILSNLSEGMTVMAQFSEDAQWYCAQITEVTDSEVHVVYSDYGNAEWLDPLAIEIIDKPSASASASNLKSAAFMGDADDADAETANANPSSQKPIKLSDKKVIDDVSEQINKLMYKTSRFLTDTTRDQAQTSEIGLTSRQKKKLKEEMKEKEKIARFDPQRYLKSMRQKARPEWFDVTKRKGSRTIKMYNLSVSTLDESKTLLENTDLILEDGRKYGLVGLNGCGKTTLLRRMSRYDLKGIPPQLRILHVEQEIMGDDTTVLAYVLSCDVVRKELLERETKLNESKLGEDMTPEKLEVVDRKLVDLYDLMRQLDVVDVEHRAVKVLEGLGFTREMLHLPTKKLSGGWRMRVSLAGALFVQPDVLLLDEPTNHLDFPSVVWLEKYLTEELKSTLLVVSHDRKFLNTVVDRILHLDKMSVIEYHGNFQNFLRTRDMAYEGALKLYVNQQEEIKRHKGFIDKFRANAKKAASVQSRIKLLQNMERFHKPEKPFSLSFAFPTPPKVGGDVISLRNVTFGYHSKHILLNGVSCNVNMQSRIGVIGANGAGKSTMIHLMMERINPLYGDVIRNRKARIAVFTQHHIDQLDLSLSPMDYLMERFSEDCRREQRPVELIRHKLGAFGLSGDLVSKRMVFLSGGEKSRVALTVLTWDNPSFIIMDEPTNHLDVETIDALINAIDNWPGGILIISHDQHFLAHIAKVYWSLSIASGKIEQFLDLEEAKAFAVHK